MPISSNSSIFVLLQSQNDSFPLISQLELVHIEGIVQVQEKPFKQFYAKFFVLLLSFHFSPFNEFRFSLLAFKCLLVYMNHTLSHWAKKRKNLIPFIWPFRWTCQSSLPFLLQTKIYILWPTLVFSIFLFFLVHFIPNNKTMNSRQINPSWW